MNIGSESVNVYADAKTEYTRQVCQILTPALQLYFLDLLKSAKEKDQDPRRLLWNFQTMLQEIPDWNQDKVLRETERIQRDSNCDYLEELLTAVFIAHTKVLSAIRISTKQKKLQLTIPKIDHFLHRTLRETGRLLWGNAFLFAEQGSGIERQKNMRQIESLIQEGIQQSIRSLLPVKNILREYLNDDDSDEEQAGDEDDAPKASASTSTSTSAVIQEEPPVKKEEEIKEEVKEQVSEQPKEQPKEQTEEDLKVPIQQNVVSSKSVVTITKEAAEPLIADSAPEVPIVQIPQEQPPMLVVETEPSVSFTNMDTIFDSDNLDGNEIAESPMESLEEVDHIETLNLPPEPVDGFEDLEPADEGGIDFETIDA